ncbi:MAG: SpoIID/LytB domain-containing protein [Myxococcota bacterium]
MSLLHHTLKNFYKIFCPFIFLFIFQSTPLASETIRVLLPVTSNKIKITFEKGEIFSDETESVDCRELQESDEISEIINKEKREHKLRPVIAVESRQSFDIKLNDGIMLTENRNVSGTSRRENIIDPNKKYRSLIFHNQSPTLEINGNFIKGDLEIRFVSGTFKIINVIDIEDYLKYTISKEMNPTWPIEALKAQAVLARTFVLKKKYLMKNCLYDIGFSALDQVYGSFKEDYLEVIQAVSSTSGEVLKYNGEIIDALYHSCCGGNTSSAKEIFGFDKPYLTSRPCPCRGECPYGKGWSYKMKISELQKIFGLNKIDNIVEENNQIKIIGNRKILLSKNAFRERIGFNQLKSSKYSLTFSKSELKISGSGFGHTVGLCQYGAKSMAEENKDYKEILLHYFNGVTIEKIY